PRAPPRADSFRRARGALRGWTRPEVRDPLRASGAAAGGAREAAGERHAAVNGVRHNLTKSQRAMAIAKLFPESGKGGRGKTNPVLNTGFLSAEYVRKARTVLKYTPETAKQVLVGSKSL